MTTTPASGAAIPRYKIGYHSDEWGQRSDTPSGIPDASGSWVRYADHLAALAAGQATAAQADSVQEDAARYRWLTGDHHKHEVRAMVYEIASSMNVRGKGCIDAVIDAARAAQEGNNHDN